MCVAVYIRNTLVARLDELVIQTRHGVIFSLFEQQFTVFGCEKRLLLLLSTIYWFLETQL